MIHVYLDDYRSCPKGFVLAQDAEECKLLIDTEAIDILSLDYDLGWGNPTGYEVVRHIVETGRFPKQIYLHTSSVSGRLQMYSLLSEHIPATTTLYNSAMPQAVLDRAARI